MIPEWIRFDRRDNTVTIGGCIYDYATELLPFRYGDYEIAKQAGLDEPLVITHRETGRVQQLDPRTLPSLGDPRTWLEQASSTLPVSELFDVVAVEPEGDWWHRYQLTEEGGQPVTLPLLSGAVTLYPDGECVLGSRTFYPGEEIREHAIGGLIANREKGYGATLSIGKAGSCEPFVCLQFSHERWWRVIQADTRPRTKYDERYDHYGEWLLESNKWWWYAIVILCTIGLLDQVGLRQGRMELALLWVARMWVYFAAVVLIPYVAFHVLRWVTRALCLPAAACSRAIGKTCELAMWVGICMGFQLVTLLFNGLGR